MRTHSTVTEHNLWFQEYPLPFRVPLTKSQTGGADDGEPIRLRSALVVCIFHMFTIERIACTNNGDRQIARNDILANHLVELLRSGEKQTKLLDGVLANTPSVIQWLSDSTKREE